MDAMSLIQQMVTKYRAKQITWHEIEEQVKTWANEQDGEGTTMNWETIRVRHTKTLIILAEIEKQIKEGDQ